MLIPLQKAPWLGFRCGSTGEFLVEGNDSFHARCIRRAANSLQLSKSVTWSHAFLTLPAMGIFEAVLASLEGLFAGIERDVQEVGFVDVPLARPPITDLVSSRFMTISSTRLTLGGTSEDTMIADEIV